MNRLAKNPRIDTQIRQGRVATAKNLIFHYGCAIRSKRVLETLQDGSYVPTLVSSFHIQ
jgi:hypothetical protein